MWSGLTKFLASIIFVGSAVGGSYGIISSVNSKKDEAEKKSAFPVEKAKEEKLVESVSPEIESSGVVVSEDLREDSVESYSKVNKDNLKNRADNFEAAEKKNHQDEQSESLKTQESQPSKGEDMQTLDEHKNIYKENELISDLSLQSEEERKQLALEAKQEEQNIYLEAVWMFTQEGLLGKQKSCVLIKKDQQEKNISVILDGSDREDDELCGETSWYKQKEFEYDRENLWIRGESNAVRELIKVNWDDMKNSRFTKFSQEPKSISEDLSELNNSCQIEKKPEENWLEVKCSTSQLVN